MDQPSSSQQAVDQPASTQPTATQPPSNPPAAARNEWPLWEVFIRSKQGLDHRHCGSLHAVDGKQALQMARDVYTRRQEGVSIWVIPSNSIVASEPENKEEFFDPMADKVYRHPTFYVLPDEVKHM